MNDPITIGMRPPHPGAFVQDEIFEPLKLSITRAADVLGVRRATVSDLVNAKAALSAEMALRIEKAFDVKMETLLNMQVWYDTYTMRQKAAEIVVERYDPAA